MKLRLPHKLQAALLAAFTAVAFTAQQTQAGNIDQHNTLNLDDNTTYNGYIYNFVPANADATTQFHSGALYRYEQIGDHMEQTATSTVWQSFANNQSPTYGHTLRLTDNVTGKTVNTDFSPLSLGGLIVEEGTYTLGRANTATDFNGFGNVNLNIMGDFTLLSRGVDKAVNSGVRFDKGGEWRIAEGKTLKFDTATYAVTIRPNLTVNVTGGGTLDLSSTAKFVLGAGTHFNVASGTTVTMSNVLETQGTAYYSGNLTLPTTLNISGDIGGYEVYEAAASDFNGTADYAGSGYRTGNATKYYIVKGGEGSTLSGLPTTVTGGDNATIVDGKSLVATIALAGENTTYYTNSSFTYNEEVMGGASGFSIAKGTVLSAGSTTSFSSAKVLHGTGTYALAATATALTGSLTLGNDWAGTVRLTNASATSLNFGNLVNGTQSTIEFNGFTGYSNAWNGTNVQNIKLTTPDGGGVAWNAKGAATRYDNNTATYSGTWSGDGTMTIAPNKLNYTFTGDISQWTGKLQNEGSSSNTFNLTFTGNAQAINAEIAGQHNTNKMNLVVDTNATFSKNVTANTLSVSNGRTATLGATATFDGLTGEGDIASTGSITLSGASGSYEFDGAITGAHLLNKTGAGTQTINGPVTVDRFTIGGGTTTFNGLVTGTGAGYSSTNRRMSVSGGTVYFNNGFAYSGGDGYALVTSANTTVHFGGSSDLTGKSIGAVANAAIVLDADASLKVNEMMNSTKNLFDNGTLEMKSGSVLTVAGKMYLTGASSNGGTIHLGNGSTVNLYAGVYQPNIMEFGLGAVVLDGAATTIQTAYWGGTVVLDSIAGTGTLTLKANADSTVRNTFSIGGNATESKFTGTIALERATGGNRVLLAEFNDMYSAAGAVVQASLSGNHNSEAVGILINSDVVQMKGLNDGSGITSANSYALASGSASRLAATNGNSNQYLDNASDGTFRTLEFTGSTATESYSTAIKVLGGVNLKMSGEGTQTFSGDMSSFNGSVSAEKGTLNVLNADSLAVKDVHIGEHAVFGVYSGASPTASTGTEGSIAITENNVLSAFEGATLNANLVMEAGSKLDVSYAQDSYGLIMGSSVTLKEGALLQDNKNGVTSEDMNTFLFEYLSHNDYYFLYNDVEEFYIQQGGSTKQKYELNFTDWLHFDLDASRVFTNLDENTYALVYNWDPIYKDVVALRMIPEPTTGTLSLLALCALAARRRRK